MEAQGWHEHTTKVAGIFELGISSNGHILIVEDPDDASQYVQAMVFPDGLVNVEMSQWVAAKVSPEVLEAEGWHLPPGPVDPDEVVNPSLVFEVDELDRAAEAFCVAVDRIECDGDRWWAMQVFPRTAHTSEAPGAQP